MAGTIIADTIQAQGTFITLNAAGQTVATMNSSGLYSSTGKLIITSDNQIGTAALPAGTVIQAKANYANTVMTFTSGAASQEIVGLTFTPLYANSLIYVVATTGQFRRTGYTTATSNWGNFTLVVDYAVPQLFTDNSYNGGWVGALGYPNTEQDYRGTYAMHAPLKSWSGAKRISANGSMGSTEGSVSFNFQNQGSTMIVLEIKQ